MRSLRGAQHSAAPTVDAIDRTVHDFARFHFRNAGRTGRLCVPFGADRSSMSLLGKKVEVAAAPRSRPARSARRRA
jgi:hypothetical protein